DPVDIDALRLEVEQQPARPAADVEDGLTQLPDQLEVERAVVPPGGVAAQGIPGSSLEPRVFEIGSHRRSVHRSPALTMASGVDRGQLTSASVGPPRRVRAGA